MSWYEERVDDLVSVIPNYEYHLFGLEFLPESDTQGLVKSVLMPGHVISDIYHGDEEAILYAEQITYYGAAFLWWQYLVFGKVSERALYGVAKGFQRAPTAVYAFEFFYIVQDLASMSKDRYIKEPKSFSMRALHGGTKWTIDKIWPGLDKLKYGQDQ